MPPPPVATTPKPSVTGRPKALSSCDTPTLGTATPGADDLAENGVISGVGEPTGRLPVCVRSKVEPAQRRRR